MAAMHGVRSEDTIRRFAKPTTDIARETDWILQAELGDELRLLHGVELNIGPGGELDYDLEFRKQFDFCLASVHSHYELSRAEQELLRLVR